MNALSLLKGYPTPKKTAFSCAASTTVSLTLMLFTKDGVDQRFTGTILPTGVTMKNFVTATGQWDEDFAYWMPIKADGDIYINFTADDTHVHRLPTVDDIILHEGQYNTDVFKPIGKSYLASCNGAVTTTVLRLFGASNMTGLDPNSHLNREVHIANLSSTLPLRVKEIAAGATLTGLVSSSIWDYTIDARDWTNPPLFVPAGRDLAVVRDSASTDVVYATSRVVH